MIILKDICKELGNKRILDNISFHISPGEAVGLAGLNGAGKTTLLNVIAGILKPDAGFIRINGTENQLEKYEVLRELSYVSGTKSQLWADLTVGSSLENCVKMYGIDSEIARERLRELEEVFQIQEFMTALPENLSLGERMRCELVYGLLPNPKILMLDEVMIGLDVSVKHKIIRYFERYGKERQPTIIYTSHNLTEVEKLCDRILLIDNGRMIFDGSIERIMREFAPLYRMELKLKGELPDLEDIPIHKFSLAEDILTIEYDRQKIDTAQILKHIMEKSRIMDVKLHEPDLEGTIQKVYEREG